jgi:CheY-like chemotaxis protein
MLINLGYHVETVESSPQAVRAFQNAKKSKQPFDAVILDLTIPGSQGGKATLKEIRKIDPAVKAIVSSGYSNDPVMADYEKYGFQGVLVKPYKTRHLGAVLKKVLGWKSG